MRCAKCGIENPVGKKFCGDCGAAPANLCPQCSADNPAGKRFCGECGTALKASVASSLKTSEDSSIREYLTRAGRQALTRSAFAEAQAQLQQGFEWIKKLPESAERDAREFELASTLAQVLMVTRGWSAPETRAAAERARELAEKSGNLAPLVAQVFGVWVAFWARAITPPPLCRQTEYSILPGARAAPRASASHAVLRCRCASFAATSPVPRSTSLAGAAFLARLVSGKFPARPWSQSVLQGISRGPWAAPI
jgi:hypothetical protein